MTEFNADSKQVVTVAGFDPFYKMRVTQLVWALAAYDKDGSLLPVFLKAVQDDAPPAGTSNVIQVRDWLISDVSYNFTVDEYDETGTTIIKTYSMPNSSVKAYSIAKITRDSTPIIQEKITILPGSISVEIF